jgi:UDP-N-acetylmuramoyl-tripeptide--D-alanyl-D-alanine ligase
VIADCYNANPVSMRAALEHLAERGRGRRRLAVLGEMAELGREADAYHREIGALVHRLGIEQVIAVGEHARAYGGDWVPSADDAAKRLRDALRPGDVVLVKGSRSVGLETVAENLGN